MQLITLPEQFFIVSRTRVNRKNKWLVSGLNPGANLVVIFAFSLPYSAD